MNYGKVMAESKSVFRFRLFIYLASAELILSGGVTAFLASKQGLESTFGISALTAFAGLLGLLILPFLNQKNELEIKVVEFFKGILGGIFPFIAILLLATFFSFLKPSARVALVISPLLACTWLMGIEVLLLFGPFQASEQCVDTHSFNREEKIFGITNIFLAYGFLLLPSHIPSWFDGFPWDSPPEFIFAAFILPLTFIIGWKVIANRFFVASLVGLLVIKCIAFSILPQSGFGIHTFTSESAASTKQWVRSYYSFATPGYTQVINRPYYTFREFPVEWINNRFGFEKNQFWLKLELSGYMQLQEDERLVFVVQGAKQMQGDLLDRITKVTAPIVFIERSENLNSELYTSIPETREVEIQGTLLFDNVGQMRLEPLLLFPDGSTRSLFETPRVWTSVEGANYPVNRVNTFGSILKIMGFLFASLILGSLFVAVYALWQSGKISLVNLYLALSGLPLFFVTFLIHKKYLNILALTVIFVFCIVILIDRFLFQRRFSSTVFLVSFGTVLLCLFLALDMYDLSVVTNFPPGQDGIEYQTFAHNIYINLDIFLAHTPPRAYKVLFPYIVGLLHIFFGHSAAAQLFMNTWCAIFSCVLIIELMKELGLTDKASFSVAVYYLSVLFLPSLYIFYFRFGLIEPFATTLLLLTYYFAIKHRRLGMFVFGILTVLLRLDYLGMVFSAVLFTSMPITGSLKTAWRQFFNWIKINWRQLITYAASLCLPVLLVLLGYFLFTPNYMLNASDTDQTSFNSVLEGLIRVIAGGTIKDLRGLYAEFQAVDVLLISTPLVIGFLIVVLSAFIRTSIFKKIDLRLSLLALSLLPAYILVRPAAYFPRFSLPLLPIDLILISLFLHFSSKGYLIGLVQNNT